MLKLLRPLIALLGLGLLTAHDASAFAGVGAEKPASGSAAVAGTRLRANTRPSEEAVRENPASSYDLASDSPVAAEGATAFRFAQTTASPFFSAEGAFAGQSIADVAGGLRAGTLTAADVPVQFVTMDGTNLLVNTRSSLALMQAGIPTSQWALIDMTGDAATEALINQRLLSNGLSTLGTSTLRITGSGSSISTLIPGP